MEPIEIPQPLLRQSYEQGAGAYPEEGCGVLSGPAEEGAGVDAFHPISNILNRVHEEDPERYPRTGKDGYYMDPLELMKLEKSLIAEGRRIKVYVHSHVDVGAYFSEEDIARATWAGQPLLPGMYYLVCGVKDRQPDGAILAYFDEDAGKFVTEEVEGAAV